MDTGADITNILTEAMNDADVPDMFVDEQRELLLRVRPFGQIVTSDGRL